MLIYQNLKSFGDYVLENQSKIRKAGAKNLYNSWTSIPHVTHFEQVDVTSLEKHRKILNEVSKIKISLLAYIVKAIFNNTFKKTCNKFLISW